MFRQCANILVCILENTKNSGYLDNPGLTNVRYPQLYVIVERVWATPSTNPDDPIIVPILGKDENGCMKIDDPNVPVKPVSNGYNPENVHSHPHLAFEIRKTDEKCEKSNTFRN